MGQNLRRFIAFINSKAVQTSLGYYAAYILLGLIAASIGPVLPHLAEQTRSTLDEISVIFIARSTGRLIGAFFSGRTYDRLPGNPLFALAVLVVAGMLAIMPFASTLTTLVVLISFLGLAEGTIDVGANTLVLRVHGAKVGPFMNALHFFWGIGALLAPIAVAQILLHTGAINWVFWLFALLALPVALRSFFTPSPIIITKLQATKQRNKVNILLIGGVMLGFILYVGAENGYGNWLFTYVTKSEMAGAASAAYLTSTFWGVFTLARLLGILLAGRFKPHIIILIDLAGCLVSTGLILFFSESVQALWVGTVLLGLSMASIYPTLLLFAGERMHLTSQITSWFIIASGIGGMFLSWLIGQFFVSFGPEATIIIIFIDLVTAFMVFWGLKTLFPSKRTNRSAYSNRFNCG